jgi:hypothetical protein
VRVRNVVAELRAFPANIAYLCHNYTPNPSASGATGLIHLCKINPNRAGRARPLQHFHRGV